LHFANELGAVSAYARNDGVDIIDGKHDATNALSIVVRFPGARKDKPCPYRRRHF
jgi:hypothetical protein